MRYLLDTNIFIAAMKGVDFVRVRLERTPLADLGLSPVVLGELELGSKRVRTGRRMPLVSPVWSRSSNSRRSMVR